MKVVLGIRFSSWNPAFQLKKRTPSQSLLKGGRDEGCLGDSLFELESGIPARKADPQPIPPEKGAVMKVVFGIRFSSWNPAFQLEKRIPSQSRRDEGCLGDPLFELESGIPARKADPQPIPPDDEGCLGGPLFELESGIPARKADPQPIPPEKGAVMKVVLGIRFSS